MENDMESLASPRSYTPWQFTNISALFVIASALLFPTWSAAVAKDLEGANKDRFQMVRDGENFIRLDKQTGAMSVCTMRFERLICKMAADDRNAIESELSRTQEQLQKLKKTDDVREDNNSQSAELKRQHSDEIFDEEFERSIKYSTKALRRFFDVMKELREDFEK